MAPTPTDTPTAVAGVSPVGVVEALLAARAVEQDAAVTQLRMVLQWALLHPVAVGEEHTAAGWEDGLLRGEVSSAPLAGPGAPLVAGEAAVDLAAALGRPYLHAQQLLGDVLELVFRLPRLWDLVCAHRVPAWLARQISRETHDLDLDSALYADRLICADPDKVAQVNPSRLIHEARLWADPDRAQADEEEAAARRGVWLRRDRRAPEVTEVHMSLETPDADLLDATLSRIAADLKDLGDTDTLDVRRAKAAGVVADPQHALDLMSGRDDAAPSQGGTGSLDLVVHLTPDDLTPDDPAPDDLEDEGEGSGVGSAEGSGAGSGVGVVERRGAVSGGQLACWAGRHLGAGGRITVRPVAPTTLNLDLGLGVGRVLDLRGLVEGWLAQHGITTTVAMCTARSLIALDDDRAVDQHDPPPLMVEQVVLRDAHCVFPGCRVDSRDCDLDHITAYVALAEGGSPGQTTAGNLAPLCRRHHNAKTRRRWTYHRRSDGAYVWVSPTGHTHVVRPHSRAPLGAHPAARRA